MFVRLLIICVAAMFWVKSASAQSTDCSIFKYIPIVDRSTNVNRFTYLSSFLSWMEQYSSYEEAKSSSTGFSGALDSTLRSFGFSMDDSGFNDLKSSLKSYTGSSTYIGQDVDVVVEKINEVALGVLDRCLNSIGLFAWLEVEEDFEDTFNVVVKYNGDGASEAVFIDEFLISNEKEVNCKGELARAGTGLFGQRVRIKDRDDARAQCTRSGMSSVRVTLNSEIAIINGDLFLPSIEERDQIDFEEEAEVVPVIEFVATPMRGVKGSTVELSWAVENSTIRRIDNGIGPVVSQNRRVVTLGDQTTTFTLTAENGIQSAMAQVTVEVLPWMTVSYANGESVQWSGERIGRRNEPETISARMHNAGIRGAWQVISKYVAEPVFLRFGFKTTEDDSICYASINGIGEYYSAELGREPSLGKMLINKHYSAGRSYGDEFVMLVSNIPSNASCVLNVN